MEISELAKELLFAESLSGKLAFQNIEVTDKQARISWKQPNFPGRPKALLLGQKKKRQKFPSISNLDKDSWSRGAILHFFANHELLAIEIMALALLKFPTADENFRKSIVKTIREEQKHMSFYLDRMNSFGIEFGDLSVSDFFWNCCRNSSKPAHFLSAISLTFEQANLDYCVYYQNAFMKIGDIETANLLQKIYIDEIGHVKNGVRWMNAWKKKNDSFWDFYIENLQWPLTPQRAKGLVFDKEGRFKANLDADFQTKLRLFGHSKGKVPDIWTFEPGGEWEAAGKKRPQTSLDLHKDISSLLLYIAGQDDIVILDKKPDDAFLETLLDFRNQVPQILTFDEVKNWNDRRIGAINPWSWTKAEKNKFHKIINNSPTWQQKRISDMSNDFSYAFHRSRSIELETRLSQDFNFEELLFSPGVIESEKYLTTLKIKNKMVAKSVFSSSGNGIFFFKTIQDFQKCKFSKEPQILFEKYAERIHDFSFLYDCDPSGNYYNKTITQFNTTNHGTYKSHIVGKYTYGLDQNVLRLLHKRYNGRTLISLLQDSIRKLLPLIHPSYRGPVGVDAMLVKSNDQLYFRPVVEINFRNTMGHYSHRLQKLLTPGKTGLFQIKSIKAFKENGYAIKDNQLNSGELILTDLKNATRFVASLSVLD